MTNSVGSTIKRPSYGDRRSVVTDAAIMLVVAVVVFWLRVEFEQYVDAWAIEAAHRLTPLTLFLLTVAFFVVWGIMAVKGVDNQDGVENRFQRWLARLIFACFLVWGAFYLDLLQYPFYVLCLIALLLWTVTGLASSTLDRYSWGRLPMWARIVMWLTLAIVVWWVGWYS